MRIAVLGNSGSGKSTLARRLADTIGVARSAVTIRMDRLESKGLIERSRSPDDRRMYTISLTDRSRSLFREYLEEDEVMVARLAEKYDDDQIRLFIDMMTHLMSREDDIR